MSFTEDMAKLSEQIRRRYEQVVGEEATKMALIIPFFSALGYDVYDPREVIPDYTADFALKKAGQSEKVDYAIAINDDIVILVEAKACRQKFDVTEGQLKRYFSGLKKTNIAVVTNGIEYRFFTDLLEANVMDKEPFFIFNILEHNQEDVEHLKLFIRDNFDATAIYRQAEEMVYVQGITQLLSNLFVNPSDKFVRFLLAELSTVSPSYKFSRITSKVIEKFKRITKKSIQGSLTELMNSSITPVVEEVIDTSNIFQTLDLEQEIQQDQTREEAIAVFEKIKAITQTSENYKLEVQYKDTNSYLGIHLGKTKWWFLRLNISSQKKSFVTKLDINEVQSLAPDFEVQDLSGLSGDVSSKVIISSIDDLDKLAPLILKCYEVEAAKH
jgi:hypothetical protein